MAWSWSHTQEAYDYAYDALTKLDRDKLLEIRREWYATVYDEEGFSIAEFLMERWDEAVKTQMFSDLDNSELAEFIWDQASEQRNCDNGGYNCWLCPYGCHTVPFGDETC